MFKKNNKKWLNTREEKGLSVFSVERVLEKEFKEFFDNNNSFDNFRGRSWFVILQECWIEKIKEIDKSFIKKFDGKYVNNSSVSFLGVQGGKKMVWLLDSHLNQILHLSDDQRKQRIASEVFNEASKDIAFMFKAASNHFMYCLFEISKEKIYASEGERKIADRLMLWGFLSRFLFELDENKKIGQVFFQSKIFPNNTTSANREEEEEEGEEGFSRLENINGYDKESDGYNKYKKEDLYGREGFKVEKQNFIIGLPNALSGYTDEFISKISGFFRVSKEEEKGFSLKKEDVLSIIQDESLGLLTAENIEFMTSDENIDFALSEGFCYQNKVIKEVVRLKKENGFEFVEKAENLVELFLITRIKEGAKKNIDDMFDVSVDLKSKTEKELLKKYSKNYVREFIEINVNNLFKDETWDYFNPYEKTSCKNTFHPFIALAKEEDDFINYIKSIVLFFVKKELFSLKEVAEFLLECVEKDISKLSDLDGFHFKLRGLILSFCESEKDSDKIRRFFISTNYISWKTKSKFVDDALLTAKPGKLWTDTITYEILKCSSHQGVIHEKHKALTVHTKDAINACGSRGVDEFRCFISSLMKAIKAEDTAQAAAPLIRALIRSSDRISTRSDLGQGNAWSAVFSSSFILPFKEYKLMGEICKIENKELFKEKYTLDLFSNMEHYRDLNSRISVLNKVFPVLNNQKVGETKDAAMKELDFVFFPLLAVALKDILHFSKMAPKEILENPSNIFSGFFKTFSFLAVQGNMSKETRQLKMLEILNVLENRVKGDWFWDEKEQQYHFNRNELSNVGFVSSALIEFNKNLSKKVVFKNSFCNKKVVYFSGFNFAQRNNFDYIDLVKIKEKIQEDIKIHEKTSCYAFFSGLSTVFSGKKQADFFTFMSESQDFQGGKNSNTGFVDYFLDKLKEKAWVDKIALKVAINKKVKNKTELIDFKSQQKTGHRF